MKIQNQVKLKPAPSSEAKQKIKVSKITNAYGQPLQSVLRTSGGASFNGASYHSTISKENQYEHLSSSNNNNINSSAASTSGKKGNIVVGSLATEYKQIQKRMDDRLKKEIENNAIAYSTNNSTTMQGTGGGGGGSNNNNKSCSFDNYGLGTGGKSMDKESNKSNLQIKRTMPLVSNDAYINSEDQKGQKFYRSQRSVAMRIKNNYDNELNNMETDKLSLIQKLNDSLVQLDKLNQEKAQMSNKLIEIMKFVRDLQRETSKGDDLNAVVNDDLKCELRQIKEESHQLREELKLAEMERLRILQRIQELSHMTQEGEIASSDMNVDLMTKTRSFADLQEEHREVIERIRKCEDEIDSLRAVTIANQEQIIQLRNKLDQVTDEKRNLNNKISVLQDRFDATIQNYQKERHDTDNMQSRHIKLISSNILFDTLHEILNQNMQQNFNTLRYIATQRYRNHKGLVRMRKTLKDNRQRILKRYLNLWFTNALKPTKCKKQKALIAEKMPLKNPIRFAFYKWQNAFQKSRSLTHLKHQSILNMLVSKNNFHTRVLQNYWTRWRDYVRIDEDDKKKTIFKLQLTKHRNYLRKFFARWREVSQELDYQIQMNGLGQRLAFKKYLSVLFKSWRLVITDMKAKRLSLLNRYWKNFKIYTLTRKQLRAQTWCILREERKRSEMLLKTCFDAMRQHKEEEKLIKVNLQLESVEVPKKEKALKVIGEVSLGDNQRQKQLALKAISKCFGKQLQEYFMKWKNFTITKDYLLNNNIKQRIIKVYLQHLRTAFTKWIEYKGATMIQFQSEIIQEQEELIKECTNKIVATKQEVEEKKQKQQCLSSKQIRKILNTAYEKRLNEGFTKWRQNLQQKDLVLDQTDKIIAKLNRRHKRQAFIRFLDKIKELKLEEFYNRKVEDYRQKHDERLKRTHYLAIKSFSLDFIRAKNSMRRLISRLDISLKSNSFKKWHKYQQYKTERQLQEKQNQKVNQIQSLVEEIGAQSDQLQSLIQQNETQQKSLGYNARRIIRLAFQRQFEEGLSEAFQHWKTISQLTRKKEKIIKRLLSHMTVNSTDYAFAKWKSFNQKVCIQFFEESIVQEDKQIYQLNNDINKSYSKFANNSDQAGSEMEENKQQQLQFARKYEKTLKALIGRVDKNEVISKQKFILLQWHQFVQRRKKSLQLLEKAIQKSLCKKGYKAIQTKAKANQEQENKIDKTSDLFKVFWRIKTRQAISQWKINSQQKINQIKLEYIKETQKIVKKHEQVVALAKERIQGQLIENKNYLTQFDCFVGWKNFVQSRKLITTKISTYQSQLIERQKAFAIQKWHQRIITTHKFKHVKTKIDRVYNKDLQKTVFQSWLKYKKINKGFCSSLNSLASLIDKVYIQRTFKQLKLESEARTYKSLRSKLRGSQTLFEKLSLILMKRQRGILTDLREANIKLKQFQLGQQAIIKYHFIRKLRSYFQEWKDESQKRSLVKEMNEDGPVAIENHQLKKQLQNLKQMALDDGIDKTEIDRVLSQSKKDSINKIEKSVCRLFCYNDQLYVLPLCLDKWKKWVQQRKMFKYWLNYIENKADLERQDLQWAFRKWKNLQLKRQEELQSLKKAELMKIMSNHNNKIQDLSRKLIAADDNTEDLGDQRDFLVKRYVGSQRLALAIANSHSEKAKQKAVSQWIGVTAQDIQERYEEALKQNLKRISALKDRIKYLEKSNSNLSEQNEELRIGALDGIEMAKSIDDLTREREKMSVDLADKAITIRKLLEDNNNLSIRLGNAQEEAQNLIRVSQIKLGQNSQVNYDEY